jgi:hypothetical protein
MPVPARESAIAQQIGTERVASRLRPSILILVFLLSSSVFFVLRHHGRPGADSGEMILIISGYAEPVFYFRSPLTVLVHQYAYRLLSQFGWGPADTIGLCSAIAGGFYVVTLLLLSRHLLFLIFNLSAGVVFIFLGHVENYAWVNLLLALYFYQSREYLAGRCGLFRPTLAYVGACLFHMLALFYLPAWFYLLLKVERRDGAWRIHIAPQRTEVERILLLFIGAALFLALGALAAPVILGLDVHRSRFVPLFHNPNPTRYFFTMFSLGHARMLLHFILMASPLGIPLLIALAWRIRGKWQTFLLVAFLCGFAFAILWHPDMGKNDWDLFSTWAIPLDILVGLLLADLFPQKIFYILSFLERAPQKQRGRDTS